MAWAENYRIVDKRGVVYIGEKGWPPARSYPRDVLSDYEYCEREHPDGSPFAIEQLVDGVWTAPTRLVCQHGCTLTESCPGCDGLEDGEDHEPVWRHIPLAEYLRTLR